MQCYKLHKLHDPPEREALRGQKTYEHLFLVAKDELYYSRALFEIGGYYSCAVAHEQQRLVCTIFRKHLQSCIIPLACCIAQARTVEETRHRVAKMGEVEKKVQATGRFKKGGSVAFYKTTLADVRIQTLQQNPRDATNPELHYQCAGFRRFQSLPPEIRSTVYSYSIEPCDHSD